MTTIFWDGDTIWSDSQVTDENGLISIAPTQKIFRHKNITYAVAGCLASSIAMVEWVKNGALEEEIPVEADDYIILMIDAENNAWYYEDSGLPCPVAAPMAMGSGEAVAMGAYLAGAKGAEVIEVATRLDANTGGAIKSLRTGKILK